MRLTIPLVLKRYDAHFPDPKQAIAEQTVRNKRASGNPYQSLSRKWEHVAEAMAALEMGSVTFDAGSIGELDLAMIDNPIWRAKFQLLVIENRSLQNQLSIIKQSKTDISIRVENAPRLGGADLVLSDSEVESIRDFLEPRKMKAKHLQRTKDDGVKQMDGRPIADPGFVTALEKIARSYETE
jgi:hypothetical protein